MVCKYMEGKRFYTNAKWYSILSTFCELMLLRISKSWVLSLNVVCLSSIKLESTMGGIIEMVLECIRVKKSLKKGLFIWLLSIGNAGSDMQKFSGWPFLFKMPFIVLSSLSSGFDWIYIGFYVFILNCIILIVINMPVILNTIYHLMLPEKITRSPCIFVHWFWCTM